MLSQPFTFLRSKTILTPQKASNNQTPREIHPDTRRILIRPRKDQTTLPTRELPPKRIPKHPIRKTLRTRTPNRRRNRKWPRGHLRTPKTTTRTPKKPAKLPTNHPSLHTRIRIPMGPETPLTQTLPAKTTHHPTIPSLILPLLLPPHQDSANRTILPPRRGTGLSATHTNLRLKRRHRNPPHIYAWTLPRRRNEKEWWGIARLSSNSPMGGDTMERSDCRRGETHHKPQKKAAAQHPKTPI